jgi:hypothetical protein
MESLRDNTLAFGHFEEGEMEPHGRVRNIGFGVVIVMMAMTGRAAAQTDLSGDWAGRVHEDAPYRMGAAFGVNLGDYAGLPITEAARLFADSWDASIQDVHEHQTIPASSLFSTRAGAINLRISKIVDEVTQQTIAFKIVRSPASGGTRLVWMDGRPHPSEYTAHTWQGFSTGTWDGNMLVVKTTQVKADMLQLNGVPHSDRATMTEHFIRHGDYLTVVTVVFDPQYLEEPFIRSTNFQLDLGLELAPVVLEIADLIDHPPGYVPHHLPGTNEFLKEFSAKYNIPFEATRGGKDTTYPEYQLTLKALMAKLPKQATP